MRLISAFILSFAVFTAGSAWAVPSDQKSEERSPIEWFLSDLGNLFVTAVSSLEKIPAADATSSTVNFDQDFDDDIFGERDFNSPSQTVAPSPFVAEPSLEPKESEIATDQHSQKKPASIGDLFSDLIAFLNSASEPKPSVSSDTSTEFADSDDSFTIPGDGDFETASVESHDQRPANEQPKIDLFSALEDAATAYEQDGAAELAVQKPDAPLLQGFFASIGDILSKKIQEESEPAASEIEIDAAQISNAVSDPIIVSSDNDDQTGDDAVTAPQQTNNDHVEAANLEVAPWDLSPHHAVFTPEVDIYDDTVPTVTQPLASEPKVVTTTQIVDASPVIRKRQSNNPAARNHLSLGKPKTSTLPEEEPSFFDHLIETFVDDDTKSENQAEALANKIPNRIVPEEKLDLGYVSPDAAQDSAPQDELTTIGEGILKHVDLYLGADTVIGRRYEPTLHSSGSCIERSLQISIFCVTDIEWPVEIASSFAQDTAFTLPGEGVIRYENGRISRAYTPFKATDFAEVVKFMQRRFGPPLEREVIWMHMIEAPKLPNTTFRWRAVSADRKDTVVLEVRNFDDLRRSFADLNRGMVRLYRDGSRPIFKHLSTMDLMLIQRRRVSQAPVSTDDNSAAN